MKIKNREELTNEITSLILNNTPIREVLRVYSLALQQELNSLDDEALVEQLRQAGYGEFLEPFLES